MSRRMLLLAIAVIVVAIAALSALSWTDAAILALAVLVATLGLAALRELRGLRAELSTARRSIGAVYEREREILAAVTAAGAAPSPGPRDERREAAAASASAPPAVQKDPPLTGAAGAVLRGQHRERVLALTDAGGARELQQSRHAARLTIALWGDGTVRELPHAYFTHVLLDVAGLGSASDEDLEWLRRTLRWRLDTSLLVVDDGSRTGAAAIADALRLPLSVRRLDADFETIAAAPFEAQ